MCWLSYWRTAFCTQPRTCLCYNAQHCTWSTCRSMDSTARLRTVRSAGQMPGATNPQHSQNTAGESRSARMICSGRMTMLKGIVALTAVATFLSFALLGKHLEQTNDKLQIEGISRIKVVDEQIFQEFPGGSVNLIETAFRDNTFEPHFVHHDDQQPVIPHIIHQVWDSHDIPGVYHQWVQSWLRRNPLWEYWIWTIDDGRTLIKKLFPDFLVLFDSYPSTIHRADAMRYFIIYQYGGIYLDLDMECLQPLDNWTFNYNCFVSEEPYPHSHIVRSQHSSNIVNGILGCKMKHPFYKMVIDSLSEYAGKYFGDFLHATGPYFLEEIYKKYHTTLNDASNATVTILPPKYFLPTFDPSEGDVISYKCLPEQTRRLSIAGQLLCRQLMITSYKNKPGSSAYADHYWVHANMFDDEWKRRNIKSIFELVPRTKNVSKFLNVDSYMS